MLRLLPFIIFCLMTCLLIGCATTSNRGTGFAERPDVHTFIQSVSTRDNFNATDLTTLFNQVYATPIVVHQTNRPNEIVLPWDHYRAIFLTASRISEGATFWNDHQQTLIQAEQSYGVSPQIIVAIIGVETRYGKFLGKYRVIDALSTLAFNYPPREPFFQSELEQYLLLTRDMNVDPLSLYGSYAGAVGLPQFMPSSYRHLAVSEIPGHTPDLWHNADDAILSVANYFRDKGWQPHQPIAVRARITGQRFSTLDTSGLHPKYTVGELEQYGVHPVTDLSATLPANLLILPTTHGPEYWITLTNFYVITRYNTSAYYAMAVSQLSDAILQAKQGSHHI